MKKNHLGFWIVFPIVFILLSAILIFLFDLLNGPLVLFIILLVALVGFAISSILLIEKKIRYRLIPWGAFLGVAILLISLAKPSIKPVSAPLFPNPEKTEVLHLANGDVQGAYTKDKAVEIYAGIPYAKAPIGELRWKETQPVEDWQGVKDCTYFAPKSMQNYGNSLTSTLVEMYAEKGWHPDYTMHANEPVSEDSLYLNIWRPATFSGNLPILVYIHGGSLTTGSSAFLDYNGETMARNGVIMITIAYRLGVFGYFAHPDLKEESPNHTTGNYGLLDQIQALRWVKENASYFGGDPDKITIAGESAGSSAVSALCASPLAHGLFQQAIGESSSVACFRAPHTFRSLEKGYETAENIMKEFHVSSIEELRKVPAEKLVQTSYSNSSMCVDGYALPKTPYEIYREGENNESALLNGYNVKEADAFVVPTFLFDPTNQNNIKERLTAYFDEQAAGEFVETFQKEIE
ncbi:MAG: carboxylesterase family protein [Bacilli bacterium]|nr:carboxylesterase family protein [Bacilli bacterium]